MMLTTRFCSLYHNKIIRIFLLRVFRIETVVSLVIGSNATHSVSRACERDEQRRKALLRSSLCHIRVDIDAIIRDPGVTFQA